MAEWTFTHTEPNNRFVVKYFNGGKDIGVMFRTGRVGFIVSEDDTAEDIARCLLKVVLSIKHNKQGLYVSPRAGSDAINWRAGGIDPTLVKQRNPSRRRVLKP
ncbi:MAG: hypothetical protein ABIH23_15630 [bacterium]